MSFVVVRFCWLIILYSFLNEIAGLASAAQIAWVSTMDNANIKANIPVSGKTQN
jgi:hypothetical protein